MTDKKFDMYLSSNNNKKNSSRKKEPKKPRVEFGTETNFQRDLSKNIESFSDWVDKMTKEHDNNNNIS